eukprot:TRINITY_DN105973_c0_g1_i1.p1 TRINITY_DN105973_c0_g1~~TRINITY_DN105973_c0_g1_i1.p1  ORF type:complete len:146 (+),score=0.42 TRINITY_DN105973_c0_g1_i1:1-438(+)
MKCPSRRFARLLTQTYPKTSHYLYEFAYIPSDNGYYVIDAPLVSYHAAEIPFVFHADGVKFDSNSKDLAEYVQSCWSNFGAYHNPNDPNLKTPPWPVYNNTEDTNILLNSTTSYGVALDTATRCDFWDLYQYYSPAPMCGVSKLV